MKFPLQKFGASMIVAGALGFLVAVIISFTAYSGFDNGALPAGSFLCILLGISFAFPSMLQDTNGGMSTMRITVFAIVLLFCTIYMKIGWNISKFEHLTIDQRWIYILGLAFGSKAFQRYTEKPDSVEVKKEATEAIPQTSNTAVNVAKSGKDSSKDLV